MGKRPLRTTLPTSLLAAVLFCILTSSCALKARHEESLQLRGADNRHHSLKVVSDKSSVPEDSNDDSEGDDSESDTAEEKARDQARDEKLRQLEANIQDAEDKLQANLNEQVQIKQGFNAIKEGDAHIDAHAKAVGNETQAVVLGVYLGDMWKEQRMFASPFYQEHLMERKASIKAEETRLRKHVKVEELKLKRQKILWEKEDAQQDAAADVDEPEKEAADKKKVAKLAKEEKKVEKEEKQAKKEEYDAKKLPWMQGKSRKRPKKAAPVKAPEGKDPRMSPDWMKALDDGDDEDPTGLEDDGAEAVLIPESDDEATQKAEKPKKKKMLNKKDDDDEEEEASKESDDEEDYDDSLPPWMKHKNAGKVKPKEIEETEVKTVKPDWMKSLEGKKKAKELKKFKSKHKPKFTEETMPSVSPTVQCVIILCWQFFIVYTLFAFFRTINQISSNRFSTCVRLQEYMAMVCPYVMFAPMLCVLFLATRMRAIQLAQGDTEKYKLPQPYVQAAMYLATYAVIVQCVFKLVFFQMRYRLQDGVLEPIINVNRSALDILFSIIKYVLLLCIYGGFTTVCLGAIFMPAPKELWQDTPPPQVSPTLFCVLLLSTTFFAIYLGLCLFRTAELLQPRLAQDIHMFVKVQLSWWRAHHAVTLAPMLCILFIVCRMRALQLDPVNGNPPGWAQNAMYTCSWALVFQVVAYIVLPLVDSKAIWQPGPAGQTILVMSKPPLKVLGHIVRFVPMLCIYGGALFVVVAIYTIGAPKGQALAEVSTTADCIVNLTTLYFIAFGLNSLAQTMLECYREQSRTTLVVKIALMLDAGQRTVMLAPMLCVLFIAARMRALQLARTRDNKIPPGAGPQLWVQEGMAAATMAVFLQVFMAYIITAILGKGYTDDPSGAGAHRDDNHAPSSLSTEMTGDVATKDKRAISSGWAFGVCLDLFNYFCLIAMYGGAIIVMVGIATMTPETLPPYHSGPLIQDAVKAALF